MSARDHIVVDLVKEVLGPREGPYETLPSNENPRDEYITGVLAPVEAAGSSHDIEANVDAVIEETAGEEDQYSQDSVIVPSVFSPALDPKALPKSIGLSFPRARALFSAFPRGLQPLRVSRAYSRRTCPASVLKGDLVNRVLHDPSHCPVAFAGMHHTCDTGQRERLSYIRSRHFPWLSQLDPACRAARGCTCP